MTPSKAPSVTVPKLNLSTLAPAPPVVLPDVLSQSPDNQSADLSGHSGIVDPSQVSTHLTSPSGGDTSSDGGDLRDQAPHAQFRALGLGSHVLQSNASDWEEPPPPLVPIQRVPTKSQRSVAPLLPAPPDSEDLQTFGNDWEPRVLQEPIAGLQEEHEPVSRSWVPQRVPSSPRPDVALDSVEEPGAQTASVAPAAETQGDGGAAQARAEEAQQQLEATTTPPASGPGPNDVVAVKITLDEDYTQLLSTPAKRQQMERMIKEDVADSLRVPRTRIQVVKLEQGSIEAYVNILPSERRNGGPTPDELADMLIGQVPHSMRLSHALAISSSRTRTHKHARARTHTHV